MISLSCLRSRKAAFAILGGIIAVLVGGIILLIIGYKITTYLSGEDATERCRLSIFMADQAVKLEKKVKVDIIPNLQCESKDVVIDVSDVTRARGGRIDDDLMKQKVAEQLYDCWNMVGAGKLTPLSVSMGFDRTYCLTCAKIKVSEKLEKKMAAEDYELKGFDYYIATRRLPKQEMSLYEYTTGKMPTIEEISVLKNAGDVVPLSSTAPLWVFWRIDMDDNRAIGALVVGSLVVATVVTGGAAAGVSAAAAASAAGATTSATAISVASASVGAVAKGVGIVNNLWGLVGTVSYFGAEKTGNLGITVAQTLQLGTSSQMSGEIPLGGKTKDTCTIMLN